MGGGRKTILSTVDLLLTLMDVCSGINVDMSLSHTVHAHKIIAVDGCVSLGDYGFQFLGVFCVFFVLLFFVFGGFLCVCVCRGTLDIYINKKKKTKTKQNISGNLLE